LAQFYFVTIKFKYIYREFTWNTVLWTTWLDCKYQFIKACCHAVCNKM